MQWFLNDSDADELDLRLANECRELLLDAGSDPFADFGEPGRTGSFFRSMASGSANGVSWPHGPNVYDAARKSLMSLGRREICETSNFSRSDLD